MNQEELFMKIALDEAHEALISDEVPIGAVIVSDNIVIAKAHNLTETLHDPTAHAEMQAITAATDRLGSKYLNNCTIYVTVEPCPMCASALYWAQIGTIVYGASDPKRGYSVVAPNLLHPKTKVVSGVMEEECGGVVKGFFQKKRP